MTRMSCPKCDQEIPLDEVLAQRRLTGKGYVHEGCTGSASARANLAERRLAVAEAALSTLANDDCSDIGAFVSKMLSTIQEMK